MNWEIVLLGAAIHLLFWDKLPEWGTLFNRFIAALPKPLQTLYADWECPFCAGFWIALVLHFLTGMWFLPKLIWMTDHLLWVGLPLAWFFDALAAALMILVASLLIKAIGWPAIKGMQVRAEFMKSLKEDHK
ncbi:hypothetical protein [Maritalea sp.]|uniref:hypothetical protein n=1 Tax=Maritalea sp. TaxID=2003361 RepID=UPI003EF9EE63